MEKEICGPEKPGRSAKLPAIPNPLHPKKLLRSKWTGVRPVAKEKHFLVTKVIEPDPPEGTIEWVEIEAAYSKKARRIAWRELRDATVWRQGWV